MNIGKTPVTGRGAVDVAEPRPHRVVAKRLATPHVVEITLAPLERPVMHRPGQYVLLSDSNGELPPRSYSVANAPRGGRRLRLLIARAAERGMSTWVHDTLAEGDTVLVEGPYGDFVDDTSFHGPLLYLAGGCGIAPILALMEAELRRSGRRPRPITLIASVRDESELPDAQRLMRWARDPWVRVLRTATRDPAAAPPRGRLPEQLAALAGDLHGHRVLIAGREGFVRSCEAAAVRCGAAPGAVRCETFFSDPMPWRAGAA